MNKRILGFGILVLIVVFAALYAGYAYLKADTYRYQKAMFAVDSKLTKQKMEEGLTPAQLYDNFDLTVNDAIFKIVSVKDEETLVLEAVWPEAVAKRTYISKMVCNDGGFRVAYLNEEKNKEVSKSAFFESVNGADKEIAKFEGLCEDNTCKSMKKCLLYIPKESGK